MKRLLLILLMGLLLRLYKINNYGYWLDEAISVAQASLPFFTSLERIAYDTVFPLYNVLLWVWIRIFTDAPFATRMLSVLFGVVAIYVLYLLGKKLYSQKVGLYAALLLAFSPFAIEYSQETRMYSLFMLLFLLSMYFYVQKIWKWYYVSTILLLYMHPFALFAPLIQFLYELWERKIEWKKFIWVGVGFIPWLPVFLWQTFRVSEEFWIPQATIGRVFWEIIGLIGGVIFLLVAIYVILRSKSKKKLLSLWIFLPLILVLLISLFKPLFVARYFIFILPGFYLLLAPKLNKWIIILLLVQSAYMIEIDTREKTDWQSISGQVGNDTVFIDPHYYRVPFYYYYNKDCFASSEFERSCQYAPNVFVDEPPNIPYWYTDGTNGSINVSYITE